MHASGVLTLWSAAGTAEAAVAAFQRQIDPGRYGQLLVFFAPSIDAHALANGLAAAFPGLPVTGCSTAGEITPEGVAHDTVVALALPRAGFRVVTDIIPDVRGLTVESGAAVARRLRAALERRCGERAAAPGHRFGLIFIDGMSYREEMCVSTVAMALDDIPIVGGSAGDGLSFGVTTQLHGGQVYHHAAVIVLVDTDHLVEVFRNDNFVPTDRKLVVTRCDPERRIVHELNAEPAAEEYAAAVGVRPGELTPVLFASHPVVVRIGGSHYCRSIQRMNPDGSLSFFCAIDDGVVLTIARPRDLISSAEAELARLDQSLGGIDLVIGFDCVLRRLDAARRRLRPRIEDLYRRHGVVGFFTYGEQFGGMHLNQTFSGVAIGRPRPG
jgi:hypothetical protein